MSAGIAAGADSERPCKCHQSFAYVTPWHAGHCCFWPVSQSCHPVEVAEWERKQDELLLDMSNHIDNTTARMKDPAEKLGFLAEAMVTGSSAPIEHQERDGQRQLVSSDRLPTDRRGDFEALGFTFGDPDPDDPMFCQGTLPEGWTRHGSEHAMWSFLHDPAGRPRVSIFYKAAFYDRSARMHIEALDWYVTCHVEYDGPLVLTDEWATRETVAASLARLRDEHTAGGEKYRRYAREDHRSEDERAHMREIAAGEDEIALKYATRLAELQA